MSTIVEIYTDAVRDNLRPLFANWEPGTPVRLGDYGPLSGDTFIHVGNVRDLDMKFEVREDETGDQKYFASSGSAEVKFNAKGSSNVSGIANVKANVEINFSSKDAVFFNAANCRFSMIRDKAAIGSEVMRRFEKDKWERSWAVVTDIVKAGTTTIAISGADSGSVVLEASGDVDKIDLADANIGLKIASQKNVGYVVEAKKGLIPLIGLSKIQSQFLWWGPKYRPVAGILNDRMLSTMRNSRDIQTEESPKDLYFGQIK